MARFFKKKEASIGKPPGSLTFIGTKKIDSSSIQIIDYDSDNLQERELKDIKEAVPLKDTGSVTWINVDGVHDTEVIKSIGENFGLHPLVMEDIVNTGQRPKIEEYDDYLFFSVKMLRYEEEREMVIGEQLSMVLGKTFLLTFQEQPGDVFDPVRERIRKQRGRIRSSGIDYLAYSLLDTIIDNYIRIIELLGEQIEDIENEILDDPQPELLQRINLYKREMNYIRKSARPARESIQQLTYLDTDLIADRTVPFLKDLLDHATQAVEVIDTYREMLTDHLNIYHTGVTNKLNEIMKVLTIFSAIFIPLTFIAGIYGTNFEYLPELHYHYAYFIFLGVLFILALVMLRFFKRKGWL